MRSYYSNSPEESEQVAAKLAGSLKAGDVVAYRGGLGAGKTAFTRGLALGLGIDMSEVSSPTFALLNVYRGENAVLYHFDMYRVTSFDSLYSTGFFDYLDGDGILAIEWSENIENELPENAITVTITPTGEQSRRIDVEGGDAFEYPRA